MRKGPSPAGREAGGGQCLFVLHSSSFVLLGLRRISRSEQRGTTRWQLLGRDAEGTRAVASRRRAARPVARSSVAIATRRPPLRRMKMNTERSIVNRFK